jgi:hypothetical protein
MLDPERFEMEVAVVVRSKGSASGVVASLTPEDLAELIMLNRMMTVGGVAVFVREQARLSALIQRISAPMPAETVGAA